MRRGGRCFLSELVPRLATNRAEMAAPSARGLWGVIGMQTLGFRWPTGRRVRQLPKTGHAIGGSTTHKVEYF